MPCNHLILCHPLLFLSSIFPSIRVFSNESAFCIRLPKYWSFIFNIRPSNEYPCLEGLFLVTLFCSFFGQCQLSWIVFVVQLPSHVWVCYPMDCSMPCFPVPHHLLKFAQIHVHWIGDAIQPSHPLSSPSSSVSIFPSIRFFSNESDLHIRWPEY